MFQTLELIAFTTAETALNTYLQRHPNTLQQLSRLEGKVISVHTQAPAFDFYLLPNSQGIMVERSLAQNPNVSLSGTCSALAALMNTSHSGHLPPNITVEGETQLLTQLQNILRDDALDIEALLGDIFGDLAAGPLSQLLKTQKQQLDNVTESFSLNTSEYLTEEARLLPTRVELEVFCNQVDDTKEKLERLEAKVAALKLP